jgi:subtilisin family serine protease
LRPLDLVGLTGLMERGQGRSEITIALIDGPVEENHPDLAGATIRELPGKSGAACSQSKGAACIHATSVAGILSAYRGSAAPAICPGCTLLVRPIFTDIAQCCNRIPSADFGELAEAIIDCVKAGAHVINLSSALLPGPPDRERELEHALNYATHHGKIVVAAAGNGGMKRSSVVTRSRSVIPVVACNARGSPLPESNLGITVGRWGLVAPGDQVTTLGVGDQLHQFSGTSAAAPFVTGTIALLWSEFLNASASQIRLAILRPGTSRRGSVMPPLLDARAAYGAMASTYRVG